MPPNLICNALPLMSRMPDIYEAPLLQEALCKHWARSYHRCINHRPPPHHHPYITLLATAKGQEHSVTPLQTTG